MSFKAFIRKICEMSTEEIKLWFDYFLFILIIILNNLI